MNRFQMLTAAVLLSTASAFAYADTVPYTVGSTPGTIVAPTMTVIANGGDIIGQFVGFINKGVPGLTDTVGIYDLTTGVSSAFVFNNKTTTLGATYNFGSFAAGDVLVFEIASAARYNYQGTYQPATLYGSNPALNADGQNHAYLTNFAGGSIAGVYGDSTTNPYQFMAGVFVGMEDLAINPTSNPFGYTDYNDDSYIFTNVSAAQTPEPSSLILLGTGALAAAGAARRKFFGTV